MPARSYRHYSVQQFRDLDIGQSIVSHHQAALPQALTDDEPATTLTALGLADHPEFEKYRVVHETYQSVTGRYRNQPISGYVRQLEFHIFHKESANLMLVDTRAPACREMIRRLRDSDVNIEVDTQRIDLLAVAGDLQVMISGGWFADLKVADVSTIGLFGGTVGESEEWGRWTDLGTLRAVDVGYEHAGALHKLMITAERTVVLFSP